MHVSRAAEENVSALKKTPVLEIYDDHDIHIAEHTRFLVGREYARLENGNAIKEIVSEHLALHVEAKAAAEKKAAENAQNQ
ncbi:MAG: hypothetical protein J6Z34_04525 [Clostridia bacterium]|nr:hypothetical protein [Clostridia bacterium]